MDYLLHYTRSVINYSHLSHYNLAYRLLWTSYCRYIVILHSGYQTSE